MILFLRFKLHSLRLAWPATILVLLLQRTPILRVLVNAEIFSAARVGQILRAMLPAAVAVGATHTLTGQTRWTTNPVSPVTGPVGTQLTVAFAFTGSVATPESYSIVGTLPPGLSVPNATGPAGNLTLNSFSGGSVTGTPTTAGSFTVTLTAFDGPNRTLSQHGASPAFSLEFVIQSNNSPPAFTTHPQSQTVAYRGNVTFTVAATGMPTPTLQWRKGNDAIPGATGTSLALTNLGLDASGSYTCVATNSAGSATSNAAQLTVETPALPVIDTQPIALTSRVNSGAFFATMASGVELSYQWRKDGADLAGQTKSAVFLPNVTAGDAGNYSVRVTNPAGFVDSSAVALTVVTTGAARLSNLSARAMVGTGDNILIPGLFVGGSGTKTVLVRAVGPALAQFGVTGELADPRMQLFRGSNGGEINDDWTQFPDQTLLETTRAAVFAFPLSPSPGPLKDASMVVSLEAGGTPYTVHASGVGGTTGVGLVEFFDADPISNPARLVNISARAQVGIGGDVLIPGFFIEGDVSLTVLIRGVGPSLSAAVANRLADPVMTLYRNTGLPFPNNQEVMTTNDSWEDTPNLAAMHAAQVATFAFPLNPGGNDGALLVSLKPGGYTVKIEGKNGTTGVGLMEIFVVGP